MDRREKGHSPVEVPPDKVVDLLLRLSMEVLELVQCTAGEREGEGEGRRGRGSGGQKRRGGEEEGEREGRGSGTSTSHTHHAQTVISPAG